MPSDILITMREMVKPGVLADKIRAANRMVIDIMQESEPYWIGMMPAMGLYMFFYMATVGRTRFVPSLIITVSLWIGMYLLFVKLLHVPWPPSLLGDWFPELRDLTRRLI